MLAILRLFYSGVHLIVEKKMKKRKIRALLAVVQRFNLECYNQNKVLMNLKFSSSKDSSLGYLDVLDFQKKIIEFDVNKDSQFPQTILLAGKATYRSPFVLEIHDPIFKCIQMYI